MKSDLYKRIDTSNARTDCRNANLKFILQNPDCLEDLITLGVNLDYKNHFKAIWIIEMIAASQPELLEPHIAILCDTISKYKKHSAIRGMSRTVLFISETDKISLTKNQEEKIIETCLDWIIRDERVAPKAYAMHTLCLFFDKYDWIKIALKDIINKDYPNQSAGYKACARVILEQINKT